MNDEGAFRVRLAEAEIYRSEAVPGLEIDLEAFWRSIPTERLAHRPARGRWRPDQNRPSQIAPFPSGGSATPLPQQ